MSIKTLSQIFNSDSISWIDSLQREGELLVSFRTDKADLVTTLLRKAPTDQISPEINSQSKPHSWSANANCSEHLPSARLRRQPGYYQSI